MRYSAIQLIGWYGVLAILTAYTLATLGSIEIGSTLYLGLNITGSAAIIVETLKRKDYQPVVLNIFWLLISFISLIRYF